jgi:hypothetical protein
MKQKIAFAITALVILLIVLCGPFFVVGMAHLSILEHYDVYALILVTWCAAVLGGYLRCASHPHPADIRSVTIRIIQERREVLGVWVTISELFTAAETHFQQFWNPEMYGPVWGSTDIAVYALQQEPLCYSEDRARDLVENELNRFRLEKVTYESITA